MQQDKKKNKILLLSDHPLSTSGVGTQARWIINGLLEKRRYSFRCFGGAMKHDNYDTVVVNEDFIIKPTDGFGNRDMLRQVLASEKPDALMLFTDPRFFMWVWEMEDEIHQICPIVYNHLWDNPPWPEYNRALYQSTDLINCINWPTYEMVHERFPDKTNYIPHAVPEEVYHPIPQEDAESFKLNLLGSAKKDHFIVLYVSRNARRKMLNDIIYSFKLFMRELEAKHGSNKATLLLHANPLDPEGSNLFSIIDMLHMKDNIVFSNDRVGFPEMRALYGICDTVINRSCNEGFGLSLLEAKMCGKPVIALKTGGMTRQVEDHITGEQYGIALQPDCRSLVGNQMVPYIFEDYVTHETVAKAFMDMYEMGPEKRAELGQKALAHAKRDYKITDMVDSWDKTLTHTINTWRQTYKPWQRIDF